MELMAKVRREDFETSHRVDNKEDRAREKIFTQRRERTDEVHALGQIDCVKGNINGNNVEDGFWDPRGRCSVALNE